MKEAFVKEIDAERLQNMSDFQRKYEFRRNVFKGFIEFTFQKNKCMDEKDESKSDGVIDIELTDTYWPDGTDWVTEWCIDHENKKLILFHMAVGELYFKHRTLLHFYDPSKKLFDISVMSFEPMIRKFDKFESRI